ncbi:hypothetical protein K440DRAFT_653613 [Wilcoxina mikolae CBS 423.85]|nr:hypothetical protein K440DRAFT_653613 [Wilcoxina mikolae CBS 423.85]
MSNLTPLQSWAVPRLQPLIDYLSDEELLQTISYAASLSSPSEVADHFKNLLGESAESLTFISDFNSHLSSPAPSQTPTPRTSSPANADTTHPRTQKRGKKGGKPSIHKFAQAPRLANDGQEALFANPQGVYNKKDKDIEDEYYTGPSRKPTPKSEKQKQPAVEASSSSSSKPTSTPSLTSTSSYAAVSKPPGKLVSDALAPKMQQQQQKQPPKQEKYIYTTTGGTPMRGATAELTDLESALRALEISTNPTLNTTRRLCPCQGMTHEVLQATPNCLSCGKIICLQEGLGPCTFCQTPLLSSDEVQDMVRSLREEAGREKMAINATLNKRVDVAKTPRGDGDQSLQKAKEHRDRLLGFQATSAQRTKIIDQAADFETPTSAGGLNQWATPSERALQLKRQQKTMRMMDWHAKEAYEKRKVVASIDLKGRRVVKEMRTIEAPPEESESEEEIVERDDSLGRGGKQTTTTSERGMYSRNPLLKGLIKPVYTPPGKGKEKMDDALGSVGGYSNLVSSVVRTAGNEGWRRVQDDLEDNERVILDGGLSGMGTGMQVERGDEVACG